MMSASRKTLHNALPFLSSGKQLIKCSNRRIGSVAGKEERRSFGKGKRWVALWGNGDYGRLGLSVPASKWQPTLCTSLEDHQPSAIACGGAHTLILTDEGRVFATGLNKYGQLGVPLDTHYTLEPMEVEDLPGRCIHVAAGDHHSAAICEGGDTYTWGSNVQGQLGLGKTVQTHEWKPQRVESLNGICLKMMALGSQHSLGLTEDGDVLSWGCGQNGRLGHGQVPNIFGFLQNMSEFSPRTIKSLEDKKIYEKAMMLVEFALDMRLSYKGLGSDRDSPEPLPVSALPSVLEVACGGYHTGAVTRYGDLYMWGSNEYGCLGFGYKQDDYALVPKKVEGSLALSCISQVACGWKHTAVLTGGRIFTWGWGGSQGTFSTDGFSSGGQLGHGDEFDYFEPHLVNLQIFRKHMYAHCISCGFNHTGAILEEI
ncbi:hypothetical protein O6H91_17G065400 [Diphasiastrum complanatum]|uniref:Uncharacterized protein n=1 Tax=Diphasiastrum complanatum TaxID=34168 RepID=A0ACC2B7U1_DIPCM|nr:hypothetical protein O6H91_17G065400 [Diphasiastrum complanatum]